MQIDKLSCLIQRVFRGLVYLGGQFCRGAFEAGVPVDRASYRCQLLDEGGQ